MEKKTGGVHDNLQIHYQGASKRQSPWRVEVVPLNFMKGDLESWENFLAVSVAKS